MANTLSEFIAHIKRNNIARSNRFRINFVMPQKLIASLTNSGTGQAQIFDDDMVPIPGATIKANDLNGVQKVISLTCMITDVPGYREQTTSINNGNLPREIATGKLQDEFYTTFLISGNYMEKKLFDAWHAIIMNESNTSINFYDDYIAHISVDCLNEQDAVVYSFELTEAYPKSVSQIKLDRTVSNQQMVVDVQWAYHKMINTAEKDIAKAFTSKTPGNAIATAAAGKKRLLAIPGLDSFSAGVQSAVQSIAGFRENLQGVLAKANDVREQVRDFKMSVLDGVKMVNGVIKDVKAISNIPNEVKNEVVSVLTDTRNQMGYLKSDLKNFKHFPKG